MGQTDDRSPCASCGTASPRWVGAAGLRDVELPSGRAVPARSGRLSRPAGSGDGRRSAVARSRRDPSVRPGPPASAEFDRVLGGAFVAGSVTLVFGEPGVGKSTLLLQVLAALAGRGRPRPARSRPRSRPPRCAPGPIAWEPLPDSLVRRGHRRRGRRRGGGARPCSLGWWWWTRCRRWRWPKAGHGRERRPGAGVRRALVRLAKRSETPGGPGRPRDQGGRPGRAPERSSTWSTRCSPWRVIATIPSACCGPSSTDSGHRRGRAVRDGRRGLVRARGSPVRCWATDRGDVPGSARGPLIAGPTGPRRRAAGPRSGATAARILGRQQHRESTPDVCPCWWPFSRRRVGLDLGASGPVRRRPPAAFGRPSRRPTSPWLWPWRRRLAAMALPGTWCRSARSAWPGRSARCPTPRSGWPRRPGWGSPP